MSKVFSHAITRLRATTIQDRHGNDVESWDAPAELVMLRWAIDAGDTDEDEDSRETTEVEYTIRGPIGADLLSSDRVRLLGEVYAIRGAIRRQPGATARTSHCIVRLRRVEG